jgi:Eukaryotic membrane protein family
MIEVRFRRPDPSHDPAGREPRAWNHDPTPVTRRASSPDDVFRDKSGDELRDELTVGPDNPKSVIKGCSEELESASNGDKGTAEAPEGDSIQARQGEGAIYKHEQGPAGRSSLVGGEAILSQNIPASPSLALVLDARKATSSQTGHEELPENHKRRRSQVDSVSQTDQKEKVLRLTPERIHELTSSPQSLPLRVLTSTDSQMRASGLPPPSFNLSVDSKADEVMISADARDYDEAGATTIKAIGTAVKQDQLNATDDFAHATDKLSPVPRPAHAARTSSSPASVKALQPSKLRPGAARRRGSKHTPTPLRFEDGRPGGLQASMMEDSIPSPMPKTIPLPPMSLPTYLQLELSSHRPSPLYIHRSVTSDFPYESSRVKVERLLNFLLLPPQLEQVLWFGTFACLDAWLYTFTILPLRLVKSFYILSQSWATNVVAEAQYVSSFVFTGTGRMWRRRRTRGSSASKTNLDYPGSPSSKEPKKRESFSANGFTRGTDEKCRPSVLQKNPSDESARKMRRHRRAKSVPSALLPDDKADILKGLLIISTCLVLMRFDASRMYHWVRGQAAVKLYVIYNVLEVGDRLLSAIGQDVLECLFSREALERGPDGHSKVHRPFWLFLLALAYTVAHSTALFYQVITLNVAVNSYSNALITLLMSNQFVEIKSTVFKKFEKENLFQLTCADVVERFQLWLMLLIIASRNIVETGGLSAGLSAFGSSSSFFSPTATNSSNPLNQPPRSAASILPRSFTLLPGILSSLTAYAPGIGHVLGPFLVVLGSEMLVDWLKHSYVNKFNNTRPAIYGRFLDVLAKDYYSNAFAEQNLTKRLGLPVIPLSCLFIRASVQTYHMFLAAWVPPALPSSATGLTSAHNHYSNSATSVPTSTTAALSQKFDDLLRHIPTSIASSRAFSNLSTILIFLLVFLVLLTIKLVLGMLLLAFARSRYRSMKEREKNPIHHVEGGRRVGGWGVVEVDDDKRRWIYEGDAEGARLLREREEREKATRERGTTEGAFEKVKRYEMVAKRIW